MLGNDLFGEPVKPKASGVVAKRFMFSPFTVLSAREGEWQTRKRAWIGLGIKSEVGRDARAYHIAEWSEQTEGVTKAGEDVSIFDPVLCELAYRWFCPPGGQIVDPFAGGSVRGIVAGALGFDYCGIDLRPEQIAANEAQANEIETQRRPMWIVGDALDVLPVAPKADFVFSCPPYGDLEVYSDDPKDLSTMEWHTFEAAYARIILRAVERMNDDSFACFVVGDFRDNKGMYRNFVSKTIDAFESAGARLYNEAILLTAIGSAAMRVTKQFEASRKLAKVHQNILFFVKGDPKRATRKITGA